MTLKRAFEFRTTVMEKFAGANGWLCSLRDVPIKKQPFYNPYTIFNSFSVDAVILSR